MPSCPVCRNEVFDSYGGRPNARCTGCGALERGRLAWMVLDRLGYLAPGVRMLNLAPEAFMLFHAAPRIGEGYLATDVDPDIFARLNRRVLKFDVCRDISLFDPASFDVVIHNHVLEHVPCSVQQVLADLDSLVAPRGIHVFTIPILLGRTTEEDLDPSLTPEVRRARFGQEDHLRIFGDADVLDIVHEALPADRSIDVATILTPEDATEAVLPPGILTGLNPHRPFVWRRPGPKGGMAPGLGAEDGESGARPRQRA